jgi:NADH:ubiquinone oxidoreductase subunit 2 (subunit N)
MLRVHNYMAAGVGLTGLVAMLTYQLTGPALLQSPLMWVFVLAPLARWCSLSVLVSATFKYLMATVMASTFFLLGTVLLYGVTGMLNIDDLIGRRDAIAGPIGFAALMFLLASMHGFSGHEAG